jgi:hypothetical protein
MNRYPKTAILMLLLAGAALGQPRVASAQSARRIYQEEHLLNVLLGQNQARINHQENAIAKQNAELEQLPYATGRQRQRLVNEINRANDPLEAAQNRLVNGLERTGGTLSELEQAGPHNPYVANQLELYLQRAAILYSAELQEAQFILQRPPATAATFASAVDPLRFGRRLARADRSADWMARYSSPAPTLPAARREGVAEPRRRLEQPARGRGERR